MIRAINSVPACTVFGDLCYISCQDGRSNVLNSSGIWCVFPHIMPTFLLFNE